MLHAKLLRYLDEVARCGSIRKASTRLNVASSAINRQILALEAELGEPIFERLPRRLRLTAAGEVLIGHVRQTLKEYDRVEEQLAGLRGVQRGSVALATTAGLAGGPLAGILADFSERHPRVRLVTRAGLAEAIPDAVRDGGADLGLCFNLRSEQGLKRLARFALPVVAVVAPGHELAGGGARRLAEIAYHPLVLAEPGMNLRGLVDQALERANLRGNIIAETNSAELMKRMVMMRPGAVTFLNPLDVSAERARGELAVIGFAEAWFKPQELCLLARAPVALDPVAHRLADELAVSLGAMIAALTPENVA